MQKINAVKGMNDILPEHSYNWLWLEEQFRVWLASYGYENIRTPIVEDTRLFIRSIGEITDIVEKEMYTFTDSLNGDNLTLRPEGTAGTLRAVIEHNLLYNSTQKLWYIGQMFRHERPQKGRYRQFYQLGVEALGFKGPDIDSEIILMQQDLWHRLGISANDVELQINCLGNKIERALHRENLIKYFEQHLDILDEDARRRLHKNPLRILDTKNPAMQNLVLDAPKLIDHLGDESLEHYTQWKCNLTNLGIKFVENPRLVRGLDYYNLSVFEWVSASLGAQGTLAAGGRYDPLIEELGGKPNYAIGFAIGIERVLLTLQELNKIPLKPGVEVFVANYGANTQSLSFKAAMLLRQNGYHVIQNLGDSSFKSQLKRAAGLNSRVCLIIGETEVVNKQVMVKFMEEQHQEAVPVDNLVNYLDSYLNRITKK
ncbi:MAG: histidyl-tRNA synthetase [Pseudomonadota bacterium]|nr:histidyl-tRNA synthetase [Pseudomonadota bacterium]